MFDPRLKESRYFRSYFIAHTDMIPFIELSKQPYKPKNFDGMRSLVMRIRNELAPLRPVSAEDLKVATRALVCLEKLTERYRVNQEKEKRSMEMNKLQVFRYNTADVRMILVNNEPWWVLKDVCVVLGLTNPTMVADRLDEDERAKFDLGRSAVTGGGGETTIISEAGLYNVILRSDKPEAKAFKRWVTHEVLPSIRKHGAYMTPQTLEEMLLNPDSIIKVLTALKDEQSKSKALSVENDKQRQLIGELQPKADYVDCILSSVGTMATSQIAADYGLTANKLNKILHEERIQYSVGNQWILYAEHIGMGYTKSETIPITRSDGRPDTKLFTRWTQKGRLMINEVLNARGIYANIDIIKSA